MKISTTAFILILIAVLALGVAIEYFGRTCPGCKRRKKAILDALSNDADTSTDVSVVDIVATPVNVPGPVGDPVDIGYIGLAQPV